MEKTGPNLHIRLYRLRKGLSMACLIVMALFAANTTSHPGIRQLHEIHSLLRSNRGLPAQDLCPHLCSRAQGWADTMAKQGSFRHSGIMGVRENIAMGHGSAGSVMRGWMNSEGHRHNLMSGGSRVGFGYQRGSGQVVYWVSLHSGGGGVAVPRAYKPKPRKRRRLFRLFR